MEREDSSRASIALRPQPVGLHADAAGLLLLPPVAGHEATHAEWMRGGAAAGGAAKARVPAAWAFFANVVDGDREPVPDTIGDDPIGAYNRFVLQPDAATFRQLEASFTGPLRDLVAVAAYATGLADAPPQDVPHLDSELLGLALATRAGWHVERGDASAAIADLERAADATAPVSPVFAAQIHAQLARLREDVANAAQDLRRAIALAADAVPATTRAGFWFELGLLYQERGGGTRAAFGEAVKAYQEAIHSGYDPDRQPELYGLLQNNIGLCYLATPMAEASDHLRYVIAVQSFREACRMFTRESHPEMWVSSQLNLANALQYAPSSHPTENLAKAVEIYETLLDARDREVDPVGVARILANQANALAHLGGLTVALEKFRDARGLAWRAGAAEVVDGITEQIDAIEAHRSRRRPRDGDSTAADSREPS